jgi:hypothetical protein
MEITAILTHLLQMVFIGPPPFASSGKTPPQPAEAPLQELNGVCACNTVNYYTTSKIWFATKEKSPAAGLSLPYYS